MTRTEKIRSAGQKRRLSISVAATLIVAGALAAQQTVPATPETSPPSPIPSAGQVYRIPVTGVVEMGLAPFIQRSLDEARDAGALAAVLDIDTPGGRVDAAEQIV